ncbi:potassium uptake protein [Legionella gratiana]|uniref:Probable potassium transport system protein Kup n=1 Tax=Legionella gratiana TaxID=45066 RepID=A0A378JDD5_9GAMM|nr:KUP/HAK/KT family potassium transporter [Legionella gratiana]KTD09151.1 potassium uptake protein [Legionella gratiana]STX45635.1 potassium uptake protein [Legionella gratiana]
MMDESSPEKTNQISLSFAALGVVFGDIGTSPLYAFSQVIAYLPISNHNIYGILSLIFWSLLIIISFKYLVIVFRADNDGEGGIMALAGILRQKIKKTGAWLLFITLIGIGLIIGDGILTPAISILSAVEGLEPLSPHLAKYVLPVTLIILVFLFKLQRIGTGTIGVFFAPIMLIWFITIGTLGFLQIIQNPKVLIAINPYYAIHFFIMHKEFAFIILGGIFLVMTGGEALFADLGHFGKKAIRIGWFTVVFPGLFLCYFGQGALVLSHPEDISYPFYSLSPHWFLPIMVILATAATIVASQAIISAAFSILKQTALLNLIPRLKIVYTSKIEKGQVYLPFINFILAIGTCALVITFRSSASLADAYGIAVNLDMLLTTGLVGIIASRCWHWSVSKLTIFPLILIIELAFLTGNSSKFLTGGWIPILIAFLGIIVMYTWHCGFEKLRELHHRDALMDVLIIDELNQNKISRQPGTGLYIIDPYDCQGESLLHHLRLNRIFSENMVFLGVKIENKPYIPLENKFELITKAKGFYLIYIHYGFTENINLPNILDELFQRVRLPFEINKNKLIYFIEIVFVEMTREQLRGMFLWQKHLFSFMIRNAVPDIQFYRLPYNKTIALATYYQF